MPDNEIERRLAQLTGNDWSEARNACNYDLVEKTFSFGRRQTYVPKDRSVNEDLQDSRGITVEGDLSSVLETVKRQSQVFDAKDGVRAKEILDHTGRLDDCSFCEVGFRVPKLLRFYLDQGAQSATGYDISSFNVHIGRLLGYDCDVWDLNTVPGALKCHNLMVCYHVLEHTHDPEASIGPMIERLSAGGHLHVEVPIEPGIPRLRYGHLIGFERGDLRKMIEHAGLTVIHEFLGPGEDRVLARKHGSI